MKHRSRCRARKSALAIGAMFALGLIAGCRHVEETENPISQSLTEIGATVPPENRSSSDELSRVQFDDIPVPPGFFFRNHRNESYSYVVGEARVGRFVYWGKSSEREVLAHYLEKMAKDPYNWSLETGNLEANRGPLMFEKPGQRCEIHLRRPPQHASGGGLLITISVEST